MTSVNYLEEMFWVPFPTVSSQVVYDLPSAVQLEKLKVQEAKEFFHLGMSGSRLPTPPFSWILSMLACIGTTFFHVTNGFPRRLLRQVD